MIESHIYRKRPICILRFIVTDDERTEIHGLYSCKESLLPCDWSILVTRISPHPITGLHAPQYLIWSYLQIWKFGQGDIGSDQDSCRRSLTSFRTSITDFILVTSSNIMSIIVCVTSCSLREVPDRYILLKEQRGLPLLSSFHDP